MTITSIEPCVKTRNRSNVFIDGTFAFSVYNDIVLEAKLKSNTDVDEKFVAKVKAYDEYKNIRKTALKEYVVEYGPISAYDVNVCDSWDWVKNPWPWEGEC